MNIADIDKLVMTQQYGGFRVGRRATIEKVGGRYYAKFTGSEIKSTAWIVNAIKKKYAKPIQIHYAYDCEI